MTDDELTKLRVEAWKTTVQVQQHFNDIELRIRSLVITVLTAVVGAAALALEQGKASLGAGILAIGAGSTALFWFVDEVWYHRLLLASVKHGETLEDALPAGFGLSRGIRLGSPWQVPGSTKELHSTDKLRVFYIGIVGLLLVLAIAALLYGIGSAVVSHASASPTPTIATPTPTHKHS
jgi:hypothetical protein